MEITSKECMRNLMCEKMVEKETLGMLVEEIKKERSYASVKLESEKVEKETFRRALEDLRDAMEEEIKLVMYQLTKKMEEEKLLERSGGQKEVG